MRPPMTPIQPGAPTGHQDMHKTLSAEIFLILFKDWHPSTTSSTVGELIEAAVNYADTFIHQYNTKAIQRTGGLDK